MQDVPHDDRKIHQERLAALHVGMYLRVTQHCLPPLLGYLDMYFIYSQRRAGGGASLGESRVLVRDDLSACW